jgi:hypothetical protein
VKRDEELSNVVAEFYRAVAVGDEDKIEQMTADEPGVVLIGTDPSEWWQDRRSIVEAIGAQHEQMPNVKVRAGEVLAYREGSFGFVADQPTFILENGDEVPFRFTAVLRHDEDAWHLLQGHSSIGVANDETMTS